MKKSLLALVTLTATATPFVCAEQPSFNYVEGGYSSADIPGDPDGFILRGSVELTDVVYLNGSYTSLSGDFDHAFAGKVDIDTDTPSIGIGAKLPIGSNTAVYGEANYFDTDTKTGRFSDSDDGHSLVFGVRSMLTDNTELYGKVANIEYQETTTEIGIGARQYVTDNLGVFAEYTTNDAEVDAYSVGVTYRF